MRSPLREKLSDTCEIEDGREKVEGDVSERREISVCPDEEGYNGCSFPCLEGKSAFRPGLQG